MLRLEERHWAEALENMFEFSRRKENPLNFSGFRFLLANICNFFVICDDINAIKALESSCFHFLHILSQHFWISALLENLLACCLGCCVHCCGVCVVSCFPYFTSTFICPDILVGCLSPQIWDMTQVVGCSLATGFSPRWLAKASTQWPHWPFICSAHSSNVMETPLYSTAPLHAWDLQLQQGFCSVNACVCACVRECVRAALHILFASHNNLFFNFTISLTSDCVWLIWCSDLKRHPKHNEGCVRVHVCMCSNRFS